LGTLGFASDYLTSGRGLGRNKAETSDPVDVVHSSSPRIITIESPHPDTAGPLVSIKNLVVEYWIDEKKEYFRAVDGVTLDIARGEVLGLAGESGSGKSTIANAILRLVEPPSRVSGEIRFGLSNILKLNSEQVRAYRWRLVSMVFQGAMNSLDPVFSVSSQVVETIRAHDDKISKEEAQKITTELFQKVGIDPQRERDYPHQLSGGMRQRVVIAMALALKPKLLIADEPTSALDVVTQKQIIDLLKQLREEYNLSVLFITHDLPLLSQISDRIAIMHQGRIVELGKRSEILQSPRHPYTDLLVTSVPSLKGGRKLMSIEQNSNAENKNVEFAMLLSPPTSGCRFYSRCPIHIDNCLSIDPELKEVKGNASSSSSSSPRLVACIRRDGQKLEWQQQHH
jgi:peptide/nickel transport system ATP-binding protein